MKNKFTRFLCFFLCFALCFAWLGPPQQAHAAGGTLIGVLLMFLVGAGIGLGINGTAHSLADGFEELVESYETNVFDGNLDFWDVLAVGSSIGTMGEVLLDKAATDLLNGFVNWLQLLNGWTEGETIEFDSFYYECPYVTIKSDGSIIEGSLSSASPSFFTYEDLLAPQYSSPFTTGTIFFAGSDRGYYLCTSGSGVDLEVRQNYYKKSDGSVGKKQVGRNLSDYIGAKGYSLDDLIGFNVYFIRFGDTQYGFQFKPVMQDGAEVEFYGCSTYSGASYVDQVVGFDSSSSVFIDSLNLPDTSEWDDSVDFSLFTGHSGKIPESVEEYNELVLQDLNSGVVPEVSTDVIVGTPDQVLPDEGDGTLAGTVSGILAQVMALPQNIANLILDGVKSIFIPDPEHLEGEFMGLLEELNDVYSFDFDLDSLFSAGKEPEDIYGYYPVSGKSLPVLFVSWHYLKKGVEYFRPYIRGFIVLMLIFYNLRQFMAIFGLGGVMNGDSGDNRRNDLAV